MSTVAGFMPDKIADQARLIDQLPIYVISLPQATARQARIAAEFAQIGLPYRIWEGVDGKRDFEHLITKTDIPAWERYMGAPVSPGHLGCYAAHVALWDHLAQQDSDIALICEDDVTFQPEFRQALATALAARQSYDILRLAKLRAKFPIVQEHLGDYRLCAYWGPFTGSACYLITRNTAARLAKGFYPIKRAHDHEMNRFFHHDYRLFGLEPFAAAPDDRQESYITGAAMSGARKFPKYKRLPHYIHKLANYPRRLVWLIRQGYVRKG